MLEELKEEEIVNKVGGRFKLSTLIQKRMIALNQGARPLVDVRGDDKMEIVIQEIMQDKIYLDMSGNLQTQRADRGAEDEGGTVDLTQLGIDACPRLSGPFADGEVVTGRVPAIVGRSRSGAWMPPAAGGTCPRRSDAGRVARSRPRSLRRAGGPMLDRQRLMRHGPALALLFAWLFLALSLAGYDPADPPGSGVEPAQLAPRQPVRAGRGDWLAHALFQAFGWASCSRPVGWPRVDLLLVRRRRADAGRAGLAARRLRAGRRSSRCGR